jgi:3-deoxy-D-manno-octulosonate 8-phosphate phosphatase (KDO 8-P phosphatase)
MPLLKDDILKIKAFLFDVDGVLSSDVSPLDEDGEPVRTACVKDGFAIRSAVLKGFLIGIITGGVQNRVRLRYRKLGVTFFYDNSANKISCFNDFIFQTGLLTSEIVYMGDDLPDLPVLLSVGIPACPADAVTEVKAVSRYVSVKNGGYGCARDIIELVMKAQGIWTEPRDPFDRA